MKTIKLSFLLTLLMSITVSKVTAQNYEIYEQHETRINGIYYELLSASQEFISSFFPDFTPGITGTKIAIVLADTYSGDVKIPNLVSDKGTNYTVLYIEENAFSGCSNLTSVTIPSSVMGIGESAFAGCSNLASVTIQREQPIAISSTVFPNCENITLYVPIGCRSTYMAATNWNNFKEIIEREPVFATGDFFTAKTIEGIEMTFTVTDADKKTCAVGTTLNIKAIDENTTGFVTIPSVVKDFTVTRIYERAFSECKTVTGFSVPNSVICIDCRAFRHCEGLKNFTIPNSVTSIGESAFAYCRNLTSITIPTSVTNIEEWTFGECTSLASITLYPGLKTIGPAAFRNCAISTLTIPNSVEVIDNYAFTNCANLETIIIPNSVLTIGQGAFSDCTKLTNVSIPNSIITLGGFDGCTGLTSITIPESVKEITNLAFYGCAGLTGELNLPNNIETIGESAFQGCTGFTNRTITLPASLTSIGANAFDGWGNIEYVVSLKNVPISISKNTFPQSVSVIYIPLGTLENNYDYYSYFDIIREGLGGFKAKTTEGYELSFTITDLDQKTCKVESDDYKKPETGILEVLTIPSVANGYDVTETAPMAFRNFSVSKKVVFPQSIKKIGNSIFDGSNYLEVVILPNYLEDIPSGAFDCCSHLKEIDIPTNVKSIGKRAFGNCGISSINIPASVTSIGEYAFTSCSNLSTITSMIMEPFPISSNVFNYISSSATLYVPWGTKAKYKATEGWNSIENIEEINLPKCATPTITFANGKLHFDCETEGVTYHCNVSGSFIGNDIPVSTSSSIIVEVYASKEGYCDSEIATKKFNLTGKKGDVNDDGDVTAQDASLILQYVAGKITW